VGYTQPRSATHTSNSITDDDDSPLTKPRIGQVVQFDPKDDLDFWRLQCHIDDADARAKVELIETWDRFRTMDHKWIEPLLKGLKG
jgi:hypothetical protein